MTKSGSIVLGDTITDYKLHPNYHEHHHSTTQTTPESHVTIS